MKDKEPETISLRTNPTIKREYDILSPEQRKKAKRIVFEALTRYLWGELHYDASFYRMED